MIHYLQTATSPPVLPQLNPHTLTTVVATTVGHRVAHYRCHVGPDAWHKRAVSKQHNNKQSLVSLLLGFFAHYAALPMDQALCVATASYLPRPGSVPFDRLCILDPLVPEEDLGCHLTPESLPVLRRELERARLELTSGTAWAEVFADEVGV